MIHQAAGRKRLIADSDTSCEPVNLILNLTVNQNVERDFGPWDVKLLMSTLFRVMRDIGI